LIKKSQHLIYKKVLIGIWLEVLWEH